MIEKHNKNTSLIKDVLEHNETHEKRVALTCTKKMSIL